MVQLIAVSGLPGSGKTTLARSLSQRLGYPFISKDDFKEVLFDSVGFRSREEKTKLNNAALGSLFYAARQILSSGGSVILENNFENNAYPLFKRLAEDLDVNIITVLVTGDARTIYQRWCRRDRDPARHQGHVRNDCYPCDTAAPQPVPMPFEEYYERFKARGMIDFAVGSVVKADVTDFSTLDIQKIEEQIRELTDKCQ